MSEKILMKGNEAVGEAAIYAGCRHYFGYPITPQNELTAYMARRMDEVGGTFIQSESEIAAISMVFGAASAGARTMTSSSGPGISLKQEGISYIAGAQLPCVIVNVMRGGPGLGNISAAQSDYFQATRGGGHGDYYTLVLAPHNVQEMFDLTMLSFHLADQYRMPALVLADGILGQMMEPLILHRPDFPPLPPKTWAVGRMKDRPMNLITSIRLGEGRLEAHNLDLQNTYHRIQEDEVRFEETQTEDAETLLVAFGTSARVCLGAVAEGRAQGLRIGLLRPITLWPFPSRALARHAEKVRSILVVEMNMGQMVEDVRLSVEGRCPIHFHGRPGGGLPTSREVLEKVREGL
ncbi:MAG: 3-methyl-2-oxobutanoate dehydrogenase subunit VorB [Candidatus Latescibacteria bacterium]|nr:3-methyl-2-oxobutanoate dehydrogenase subunit VorB [Candidatus Latescibacterota bacterium]